MVKLYTEIVGTTKTMRALDELRRKFDGAFRGAVYMLATNVISTALKLTPADTGYLRASRYVRKPSTDGSRFTCEAGFGAPYALWVHEVDARYIVGEWKFLARALDYHLPTADRELAAWTAKLAAEGRTVDDVPETHPRIWTGGERIVPNLTPAAKRRRQVQRAKDRAKNVLRMARERAALEDAARRGVRPPRPGR